MKRLCRDTRQALWFSAAELRAMPVGSIVWITVGVMAAERAVPWRKLAANTWRARGLPSTDAQLAKVWIWRSLEPVTLDEAERLILSGEAA